MLLTQSSPPDAKRLAKAQAIVASGDVEQTGPDQWQVRSSTGSGHHVVTRTGDGILWCSCPDFAGRNGEGEIRACKHALAVELVEDDGLGVPEQTGVSETGTSWEAQALAEEDDAYEVVDEDTEEEIVAVLNQLQADGVLWQIAELESEVERIDDLAAQEISVIESWKTAETDKLKRRISLLAGALDSFMRGQDRKTIRLPHGELQVRARQDKIVVDEQAFDFSQEQFVRIVPEQRRPDLMAIKAHLKTTGELLPGVDIEPQQPKFSYKTIREEIKTQQRKEVTPSGRGSYAGAAD